MASGTINGSPSNSHYSLTCEWSSSANTSANTSSITAVVYLNGNGYTTSSSYWSCVINGTTVTSGKSASIGGKTELGRRTWTVNHNNDGSASVTISFSYSNGLSSSGTYTTHQGSGSGTATMDKIARGSTISLSRTSATLGADSVTVNISRASSSFTHKVQLYFGSYSALLAEGVATSYTFTPNISLCNQVPNATSGNATVKVQTMNGSTWVAETSKSITFNVPSSVKPSVGISITPNNALSGKDVAGKTTFTVKPTNASGSYSSTIKSYSITGGGLNSSSSGGATTGTLGANTYTFKVQVTDSRGRTASASATRTVHPYSTPSVQLSTYRCDAKGNKTSEGTYLKGTYSWNITNIASAGVNVKQYRVLWKEASATSYSLLSGYDWKDTGAYSSNGYTLDLGGGWKTGTAYNVRIEVKDSYNTVSSETNVPTINAMLDIEAEGVAIGGIHQGISKLEVQGDISAFGNGKSIKLGTGSNDVYIHNASSGKYLQLKDDGTLRYGDKLIYNESNTNGPVSGNWFSGGLTRVGTDGVMEIGRFIDFHNTGTTKNDYSTRLSANGDNKNTVYLPTGNGTLSLDGHTHSQYLGNSGSQTMNVAGGKFSIIGNNNRGHIDVQGCFHTRGDSEDLWFERHLMPASWQNTNLYIGYSDKRWKMVYATNGTIQTSDKRHKAIIDDIDNQDCFNMVKNTSVFNYVMLNKNKEEMNEFERIEETLMNSGEDENIKMGIMAQDILNYDCSKYVLTYSEYIDEETGEEKDYYGIDAYAFSSAIMGALKQEIQYRELLESKVKGLEEKISKLEKE